MIVEAILKEEDEIRRQERTEGNKEGLEKGALAQRQTILKLLHFRFPASVEESEKYIAYLARIHDLDTLAQLVNHLLTAETLAEFEQNLLGYLPKDEAQK